MENPADPNSDALLGPRVTSGGLGAGSSLTQTSHARLAGALRRRSDAHLGRGGWGSADTRERGFVPAARQAGPGPVRRAPETLVTSCDLEPLLGCGNGPRSLTWLLGIATKSVWKRPLETEGPGC